ncbi:MAG: tape measure protein [Rhizobiaceae bacterium]|nr:tape measure protein [Rhizobiaceae bacterium]
MSTDIERLIVALEARTKAFENALAKANSTANKRATAIEKRFAEMNRNVSSSAIGLGRSLVGILAGGALTRELIRLSDSATRIDNSLKVAGLAGAELERVYKALAKAAMENGAPVETLAALYGKAAQAQKELGVTTEELLGFTNNVALALRVASTDAQAASGALLQLGQALGSGKVQAEEFNSVLEGAPTIAQAAAAGLKEAGGSVSKLKQLVVDGAISSRTFFRAFEAGSVILEEKVAGSTFTVGQATTNLWNALTDVTREFNASTGAGKNLADGLNGIARAIEGIDVSGFIERIRSARKELEDFLQAAGNSDTFKAINEAMGGADANGNILNPDISEAQQKLATLQRELEVLKPFVEEDTKLGLSNTDALTRVAEVKEEIASLRAEMAGMPQTLKGYAVVPGQGIVAIPADNESPNGTNGLMGGSSTRGGRRKPVVNPVSVKDNPPPPGKSKSGSKSKVSDYEREVEQIRERTAAITAETSAMASLNPLIDDFGYTLEYARAKQELLSAAQKSGLDITPKLEQSIDAMASGYANAAAEAEKLAQKQDKIVERADFFAQTTYDAFSKLIPQIRTGNEALDGFLNTLIEAVAQAALLGTGPFAGVGGGGGLLGNLFQAFPFADGGVARFGKPLKTFANGGVSRTAAIFGETGRAEAAVPLPDGRRIPVDLRMPERSGTGGMLKLDMAVTVSGTGDKELISNMEAAAERSTEAALKRYDRGLPYRMREINRNPNKIK